MKNLTRNFGALMLAPLLALAPAAALTAPAKAEYPERPIVLYISYGAGGATDYQARDVTAPAARKSAKGGIGAAINIVNKPGAGGRRGWNEFVNTAKADGYELAAYNVPHFIAQSIGDKKKPSYNRGNLEPIANWGADPAVLIVSKESEFKTLKDLVDFARANPGKLTANGAGTLTGHHIAFLQFQKAAGIKMAYVPDPKGGANALAQVKGGHVKAGFNNLSDAFRSKDELRILAVAASARNTDFLPDVPTFAEQGFGAVDDSSVNFRGVMAPKGTPNAVLEQLSKDLVAMFSSGRVKKKMKLAGAPLRVMNRAEVQKMWAQREKDLKALLSDL